MARRPNLEDLKKKFEIRFAVFSVFISAWLLVDEFIKEGYFFSIEDIAIPGTHEFLIASILLANLLIFVIKFLTKRLKWLKNN